MPSSEYALDSATTARESIYRSRSLTSDGTYNNHIDDCLDKEKTAGKVTSPSLGDRSPAPKHDEETVDVVGSKIEDEDENGVERPENQPEKSREIWKFRMRPADDDEEQDWWFASTAIPLLAATIAPLANVMSIAAIVTSWKQNYNPAAPGIDDDAMGIPDPLWCINLNIASLVCAILGNIFLLFNFTRRIRYIVALPVTIVLWFVATSILMAITITMNTYDPPLRPSQTYSQGFWHAVIAAVLYLICALLLTINMIGYFLGHYPQHFELNDEQRNLILQTMMFFVWLAGGAGIFSRVCDWAYVDALYFCDVTILTIGFGDFFPDNDAGRGLVFPFSVGGIIILGLVVSSIRTFAQELGHDKVIKSHIEHRRTRTLERTMTASFEAQQKSELENIIMEDGRRPTISAPFDPQKRTIAFDPKIDKRTSLMSPISTRSHRSSRHVRSPSLKSPMSWASSISGRVEQSHHRPIASSFQKLKKVTSRTKKLLILREEKDRFDAMRAIQYSTRRFKRYFALSMSVLSFALLWCVGAVVFWQCEEEIQGMTYFEALYFCYVSLLTVGYGDLAPRSNAGKPFFIVWSLVAVPTMTILISDMGDTVVASYKRGTFTLGDWTILPKQNYVQDLSIRHPFLFGWAHAWVQERSSQSRVEKGFPIGPEDDLDISDELPTLEELAHEDALDEHDLARKLTTAIRRTADDLKHGSRRRYTYEEWVEFTRLIRFTRFSGHHGDLPLRLQSEEEDEGVIEWDWIGEDSPMMADETESEWLLNRLCESLGRYVTKQIPPEKARAKRKGRVGGVERGEFGSSRRRSSGRVAATAAAEGDGGGGRFFTRGNRSVSAPKVTSMAALRMKQR